MDVKVRFIGALNGAIAAACYGMNPLFALPLYSAGADVNSVLFYRYIIATFVLWLYLKFVKKYYFKLTREEILPLIIMGLIFSFSSITLFKSYTYMDAGIASTILFIYPILVAVIMAVFFKEKLLYSTVLSLLLTTAGVVLLYHGNPTQSLSLIGVLLVFLAALSYAMYIVGVKNIHALRTLNSKKSIFYVMLFGSSIYIYNVIFNTNLYIITEPHLWINILALSILPTIISLIAMTISIKLIGSTAAAVLGALEPITAIFFGVVVFHEQLTPRIIVGIITILFAVMMVIIKKR